MGGSAWLAWAAIVAAVSLWAVPGVPRAPRSMRRARSRWSLARMLESRLRAVRRARSTGRPENEVGTVLVAVAARLRAGMAPEVAWQRSLRGASPPVAEALRAELTGVDTRNTRRRGGRSRGAAVRTAVDSAMAAREVAAGLGAELAVVLDACADGIEEAGRAASDRAGALGGPRATARLLGWLPLGGLVLGTGLGADPLGWLLGSWWGAAVGLLAIGLTVAGHLWIHSLVAGAERAGR
ncbi:type II secretion protein F [Pseudactinotalea sp. HY160]|uniref:type II secretion protein F n=1 Tax=Pseudactinotalea sp. HY160 TaxID=2654490 RepID=UPI00128BFB40|nr:type II secretion protein F [Pseudactinotalea sp. HY160]MPV48952.1 type II secretion protein F [Pseudactinotalea sp. HY160]